MKKNQKKAPQKARCTPRTTEAMLGDCEDCGHSVAYHMPFVGCIKCSCEEFV